MDYDMEISEILKLVRVYEKKAERKIPVAVGGGICDKRGQSMDLCLERI